MLHKEGRETEVRRTWLATIDPTAEWTNRGQYVRRVAQEAEDLVAVGLVTQRNGDALISAASESNVDR